MNSKPIAAHTDSIPHFLPLHYPVFNFLETRMPYTIATNGLNSVITLFQLNEGEAEKFIESENLQSDVSGGDISPAPLFSDEWIAFGQTRGFTRYNLKTHEFHDQLVCTILDEVVKACRALNPTKNIFVFMIKNMEKKISRKVIKIYDLSNEKPLLLTSLEAGKIFDSDRGQTLQVRDSILFYGDEQLSIISVDQHLEPVPHPLTKAFKDHQKKILKLSEFVIHPVLPFAIVYGAIPWILSWKDNENDATPFLYINKGSFVLNFQISHDGKYLSWMSQNKDFKSKEKTKYWVAKIDEKIAGYLGPPQLLGSTFSESSDPVTTGWAENPNTVVVSEMEGLYWWHVQ